MPLHALGVVLVQLDEHAVRVAAGNHPGVVAAEPLFRSLEPGAEQAGAQRANVIALDREVADGSLVADAFDPNHLQEGLVVEAQVEADQEPRRIAELELTSQAEAGVEPLRGIEIGRFDADVRKLDHEASLNPGSSRTARRRPPPGGPTPARRRLRSPRERTRA